MSDSRELHLVVPAIPENVIVVRQAAAGLGDALGLPPQRVDDLKAVVTEAANNVVLHAYVGEPGPLELTAVAGADEVEIVVEDRGSGFTPHADQPGEPSLGIGLPLIAALSDSFEISGGAERGTRTTFRFAYRTAEAGSENGRPTADAVKEVAMAVLPGDVARGILARVIGALAARLNFPVDLLSDTVLIGDAVSGHTEEDFVGGRLGIHLKDGDGTLDVRIGPLSEGGAERLLEQMDVPGGGSLRDLAEPMTVERGETEDGQEAEFLHFNVAP